MTITLTFLKFKNIVNASDLVINYVDVNGNYYLYSYNNDVEYVCVIDKNDADDFEANYKQEAIALI